MHEFSYTVEKTRGGHDLDAWTARAHISDAGVSLSMSARGPNASEAKLSLASQIGSLKNSLANLEEELR